MTPSASGSANAMAASAEASMILSAIAQLADDIDRAFARGKVEAPDAVEDLPRRDGGHVVGRGFDEREQLSLERATIPLRAGAQAFHHIDGNVLDREAHGRHGSIVAPEWNLTPYTRSTSSSSSWNGRPPVSSGA